MLRWEIEAKLCSERAWLLETFGAMSEEERTRPATASEGDPSFKWSAQSHFVHLMDPERQACQAIRRQIAGDPYPFPPMMDAHGERLPGGQFLPILHTINDRWVRANAHLSFDEAVALSERQRAETLQLLAELSDDELAQPLRNMPWSAFCGNIAELFLLLGRHGRGHYQLVVDGWQAGGR